MIDRQAPSYYRKMSERELLDNVRKMAHLLGWRTYHTHNSQRSESGFTDLVLVKSGEGTGPFRGRVLFRELKTEAGRLTPPQHEWIEALRRANADVAVWRPADWVSGRIKEELR